MKISEVMPNLLINGGIFQHLDIVERLDMSAVQMGTSYFFHSGEKTPNALLKHYVSSLTEEVSSSNEEVIGDILNGYFKERWDRSLTALLAEYSPIENYDRNEEYTDTSVGSNETVFGAQSNTNSIGEQETTNAVGSQTTTTNIGSQSNSSTKGAESSTNTIGAQTTTNTDNVVAWNEVSETETNETGTVVGERNDSATVASRTDSETIGAHNDSQTIGSRNDTQTVGARSDTQTIGTHTDSGSNTNTVTHTSHIHGNVGVTTNQQMITSELELRQLDFIGHIFKDIDSLIALNIYS